MPTYIVKDTHIKHGVGKVATVYGPGEEIELSAEEAKKLGDSVEPVQDKGEARKPKPSKRTTDYNVPDAVELIRKAKSEGDVDALIEEDDRKGVLEAAEKRKEELKG